MKIFIPVCPSDAPYPVAVEDTTSLNVLNIEPVPMPPIEVTSLAVISVEYDDEAYYWALAFNDTFSSSFQGTRVFSHPSILSLLFDRTIFK